MNKKQQFNIYLDPELVAALKHKAIDEQLSLSDLVGKILTASLNGTEEEPADFQPETPAERPR